MENTETSITDKHVSNCKNHPQVKSGYFLSDQPSIRYCKNCALNVALCGRKIEKQLTPEEQQRKKEITSIVSELKKGMQAIAVSQSLNSEAQNHYQEMGRPFQERINELQKSINELISLKELLCTKYQEKIVQKIESLKSVRQKAAQHHIQIEKVLQKIESNFGNLIEMEIGEQLQNQIKIWNEIIIKSGQNLMNQKSFEELKQTLVLDLHELFQVCDKICQFRVNIPQTEYRVLMPLDHNKENFIPVLEFNSLESSRLVEELKINLTANAVMKNKTVKKKTNERYQPPSSKRSTHH